MKTRIVSVLVVPVLTVILAAETRASFAVDEFVTGIVATGIAFDAMGNLFLTRRLEDDVIRIDPYGAQTVIATGLGISGVESAADEDLAFAPNGDLYVSIPENQAIYRIIPEPAVIGLLVFGGLLLRRKRRA